MKCFTRQYVELHHLKYKITQGGEKKMDCINQRRFRTEVLQVKFDRTKYIKQFYHQLD